MPVGKIIKSLLWAILMIALTVALNLGLYELSQYFAEIAATQVHDDSAYTALRSQSGITTIIWLIYSFFMLLLGFRIYRVWVKKDNPIFKLN